MTIQAKTAEAPQWVTKELKDNPYYTRMHRMPGLAVFEVRGDGLRIKATKGQVTHFANLCNRRKVVERWEKGGLDHTDGPNLIYTRREDLRRLPDDLAQIHIGPYFSVEEPQRG